MPNTRAAAAAKGGANLSGGVLTLRYTSAGPAVPAVIALKPPGPVPAGVIPTEVFTRLADTGEGRRYYERARRGQSAHVLLCLLLDRRRKYRRTRGQVEAQRETRPVALWALLHIAVGESEFAVQHLNKVNAGPSAGGNGEFRRACQTGWTDSPSKGRPS